MIDVTKALYQWLSEQTPITEALGTYLTYPAIFDERVPDDHVITAPVILIDAPEIDTRSSASARRYRAITVNIRVYARISGPVGTDNSTLAYAANLIAETLHNARFPIEGGIIMGNSVSGPIAAPTESPSLGGRLITLRWNIQE